MDTKKTKKVKLRNGPVIEVSEQIFNWRKKLKSRRDKLAMYNPKASVDTLYNEPECPINDKQEPTGATPNWDIFK